MPRPRARQRRGTFALPLRHAATAQVAEQLAERGRRQRRVGVDQQVDQRVVAGLGFGAVDRRRGGLARRVDAHAGVAPRDAQQAAVVHAVEQLGRSPARAAEPVAHAAVREVRVDLGRVHGAALAHEVQHRLCLRPARLRPGLTGLARVHQRRGRARQEAVVDEEVLLHRQPRVAALQLAGTVVAHAVAQDQVLRARRRAQRVGLHEAQALQRLWQRAGREQRAGHGVAAQVVESDRHAPMMHRPAPAVRRGPMPAVGPPSGAGSGDDDAGTAVHSQVEAGSPAHALNERAGAQAHFIDLCRVLGVPEPADPEDYCFERGVTKTGSAGARTDGFADVWQRGHFAWEYKAPGRSLEGALKQLMMYALPLENPPLLVVSDRQRIEVHTHFTGTPSETPCRSRSTTWRGPRCSSACARCGPSPTPTRPRRSNRDITEEAARTFAGTAERLRAAGVPAARR